jgi:hypothetical protein
MIFCNTVKVILKRVIEQHLVDVSDERRVSLVIISPLFASE